MAYLTITMYSW